MIPRLHSRLTRTLLVGAALLLPSVATAQACRTLDECYATATSGGAAHVQVIAPTPGQCDDAVGCIAINNRSGFGVAELSKMGGGELKQTTPYGLSAVLAGSFTLPDPVDQINPQGLTLAIRAIPPAGVLDRDAVLFTVQSRGGDAFEIGVSRSGALYVGRRNAFWSNVALPYYRFELWDPALGASPHEAPTIFVRFGADGHTTVDAISVTGGRTLWRQGLLELGFPQTIDSYPFVGEQKPPRGPNLFAHIEGVRLGGVEQGPPAYGAFNRMTVVGKALTDPELVALFLTEFAPTGLAVLDIHDRPCNTGEYLNFDGAPVKTPCGTLAPGLPQQPTAEGPAVLRVGDQDAVPAATAAGALVKLQPHSAAQSRDPAWSLRSFGYGQYALRARKSGDKTSGDLYLTIPDGEEAARLAASSEGVDQAFSLEIRNGVQHWVHLGSGRPLCRRTLGGAPVLALCASPQHGEMTVVKGAPAAPTRLRAYASGHEIQVEWDRPPSFPGTELSYRIRVEGNGVVSSVGPFSDPSFVESVAPNTEYEVQVTALIAADHNAESVPATVRVMSLARSLTAPPPGFVLCALEGGRCDGSLKAPRLAAYGSGQKFLYRIVEGAIDCRQSAFAENVAPISGAACFSQDWADAPKGLPGATLCAQRDHLCQMPAVGGLYIMAGGHGVFYGLRQDGKAHGYVCDFGRPISLATRSDYRCFQGAPVARADCLNGPVRMGGHCVVNEGTVSLAYFGGPDWFVSVPVTTSISCTPKAFGYLGPIEGTPTCWTGRTSDTPPTPPGLVFCAVEASVCPAAPSGNSYLGFMRNGGDHNRWFRNMVYLNTGHGPALPCANVVGYTGNTGYDVCFRVPDSRVFTSGSLYQPCADEYDNHCLIGRTWSVAYGKSAWQNWRIGFDPVGLPTSVACRNEVFGDPVPGVDKACYRSRMTAGSLGIDD